MPGRVLVTMQFTTSNTTLGGEQIAERFAAIVDDLGDSIEHASISLQPHDADPAPADDVCTDCGAVIGDPEQHVAWHATGPFVDLIRVEIAKRDEITAAKWRAGVAADEPELRTFGEEPAHA